jgi:cleavage stimulation factor subunit 3|tara:strand:+ start:5329 stop:6471 length:1143 start_codon:yes stop_codon:yes gene_type:complete
MVTTNDPTSPDGVAAIKAAFEYTLDTIGEDVESGPLWLDFLNFLRAVDAAHVAPGVATAHAERARDDEVRSAYQRSVSVPTNSVDALYREYDTFETTLDATAGKTVLATIKPLVDKARVVLKERKRRHEKLDVGGLCVRPGGAEVGTADQTKTPEIQSKLWRDLARWERGNPQQLEADTENGESWNPQLTTRINLAYEQSLMSLRFCPDMWLEFASWHEKEGRLDKAVGVLQRGKEANPECALLTFARADIFEKTGDVENAKAAYEEVLDLYENECAAKETKAQLSVVGGSTQDGVSITGNTAGSPVEYVHPVMSDATTLMYVEYMRCCRRVEGAQSARKVRIARFPNPGTYVFPYSSCEGTSYLCRLSARNCSGHVTKD